MKEQTATNPHSEWTPGMFADVYWRGSVIAVVGKSHVCLVSEHGLTVAAVAGAQMHGAA
jgi:hypothetical protein